MNFHNARHATGAKPVTPQTLIQMSFDDNDGDERLAAISIVRAAETNAGLAAYLIDLGARTAVGSLKRSDRSRIFTGNPDADVTRTVRMPRPDTRAAVRRAKGRVAMEVRLLLDARLSSGKRMGDANASDLTAEVSVYEPQARNMTTKVNYFRAVAARLPAGKVVGDVLDNAALTRMWAAAGERIPA